MAEAILKELASRDAILALLSEEEIARVSTGETAPKLAEGEEYLDLLRLDQGVQRANPGASAAIGHALLRSDVEGSTWSKIMAKLAG